jgi:hypothetical protein
MVEFMQQWTTLTSQVYYVGLAIHNKGREMLTYGAVLMTMSVHIQLLGMKLCWSTSSGSCLADLVTILMSLLATTTCLPTRKTR